MRFGVSVHDLDLPAPGFSGAGAQNCRADTGERLELFEGRVDADEQLVGLTIAEALFFQVGRDVL